MTTRTLKRKRIILDPDDKENSYVDIPVVAQMQIVGSLGQLFKYKIVNDSTNTTRQVREQEVKAARINDDVIEYDDDVSIKVERIKQLRILGSRGQIFKYKLKNEDPAPRTPEECLEGDDEEAFHHEKVRYVRYYKDNDTEEDLWIDVEQIELMRMLGTNGQIFKFRLANEEAGDPVDPEDDDDPYLRTEEGVTVGFCSDELELMPEEAEDSGVDPPWRLDPWQNIVNISPLGYWLEVSIFDATPQPETGKPIQEGADRIANGNGNSGVATKLSTVTPENGTKLIADKSGEITYPTTWVWKPKQSVIPLGPGIFIDYPGHPSSCDSSIGGFYITADACGGNQSVSPCTGPAQIIGLDNPYVTINTSGNLFKKMDRQFYSSSVIPGVYYEMSEAAFVGAPIAVSFPPRASDGDPGQLHDKFSPVSADQYLAEIERYNTDGGSTLFFAYCSANDPNNCLAGGTCGEPMVAGLSVASYWRTTVVGYNHDDIYLFDHFPTNSGKAEEDQEEAVKVKFNQSKSDALNAAQFPGPVTTTIKATLYAKKDWEENDAFKHEVVTNTLKFTIKPPLKKKEEDSDDALKEESKEVTDVGPKTYDITVVKKENDQWEIRIEEA